MADVIGKYQNLVNRLVDESFPTLNGKKIRVFELKFTRLYAVYVPLIDFIGINKLCRNFSSNEIKGIIAHELCHAEYSKKYGFLKTVWLWTIYWFDREIRKKEEIKTDKLTIRKGYAKQLVLSAKRLEKEYPQLKNKTYLSSDRIKLYAESIRKW